MDQTVAIFGATGAQGAPVVTEALTQGMTVRAVARDADKIQAIHPGAQAFEATLADEDAIAAALVGVDAAFLHLPMPNSPEEPELWLKTFLTAAHRASLPLLVFTTGASTGEHFPQSALISGSLAARDAVLNSGIPAIVLQPTIYLENLLVPFFLPELRSDGVLDYPPLDPARKVSWTSHHDQARVAVAAMGRPDLAGKAFDIASPDPITGAELAGHLSGWVGRDVSYAPTKPEIFAKRVGDALQSPGTEFALTDLYGALNKSGETDMVIDTAAVEDLFKVELTTVAEHIRKWASA